MTRAQLDLLLRAAQMLLEYNECTEGIHHAIQRIAVSLDGSTCHIAVSYSGVAITPDGEATAYSPVREIRYNTAVLRHVYIVLQQVQSGTLSPAAALERLRTLERDTPRCSPYLSVTMLAAAAVALALLLGADASAAAVAGVAGGFGLRTRQLLSSRHISFLALPFTAAFIGGIVGGIAVRLGLTTTPGLALIVPCLLLVPGPHLINGLLDLIDNHPSMSIARIVLATSILIAASLGLLVSTALVFTTLPETKHNFHVVQPNILADAFLAAIVTAGFSVSYNTPWPHVGLAMIGGATGHGLRYMALRAGATLDVATFCGALAVGAISAWMGRSTKMPVAVIAFAGAVTMVPGLQIYTAIRGVVQIARLQEPDLPFSATIVNGTQAVAVIVALSIGLIVGIRIVTLLLRHRSPAPH